MKWTRRPRVALLWIAPLAATAQDYCPSYEDSELYRPRSRQIHASSSDWIETIEDAREGDEILLADGTYFLNQYAIQISQPITLRSASGDRGSVVIQGQGYGTPSEGIMVMASSVTIADLTITGTRNHGISIKGEHGANATQIYNVHAFDIGTQHIKGTPSTADGVVACSKIGYSADGVRGDYLNGIDIHGAVNWTIRDNDIYNIWGDGTGCEVDADCGTYLPGGGPAVLLWNNASGNTVERNTIVDCFRGIAMGFTDHHSGGMVRNNFIFQSAAGKNGVPGDAGISLRGSGMEVDHNTVILGGEYPGAIEIIDSSNVFIRNNLLSQEVWNRGQATYHEAGNKTDGTISDLVSPGQPQLTPDSDAVDFPTSIGIPGLDHDIDGDPRPQGARVDSGCDEIGESNPPLFLDEFVTGDTGLGMGSNPPAQDNSP